ncbi:MAG: hypothetical protein AMXMBFR64_15810 [Myxococcales bacterium]
MRPDLDIRRFLLAFAALSVLLTGLLAVAPAKDHFSEWRATQERYNSLASAPIPVELRQVWKPDRGTVDRCTSCHLGMGPAEPLSAEKVFAAHPPMPHDPSDIGCTVCHSGQGRATTAAGAHGKVAHWTEPLLPMEHIEAGCGSCHGDARPASSQTIARGEALFAQADCYACHKVDGKGRGTGPDLSGVGARAYVHDWNARHAALAATGANGPWKDSFRPVPLDQVAAIDAWLDTRIKAPRLMAAQTLVHDLGCLGCHKVRGTGGDDGPELSESWRTRTPEWLTEHFISPQALVPGSLMPDFGLSRDQASLLTTWVLSLRGPGRTRNERTFAQDGATLYGAFCAACHGPSGEGRRYGQTPSTFPAIGSPDFLAVASDDMLRKTLLDGRPGRRMPAWGTKEGGFRPEEVEALVQHLRSLAPAPDPKDLIEVPSQGDATRGAPLYAAHCASCHGAAGEGKDGPALRNAAFLAAATDTYIRLTVQRGRGGTAMRPFGRGTPGNASLAPTQIDDIIAFIRKGTP